jgi:hypothetical protein
MLDQRFYWGTIRKAVVAFGNMFNNITVERRDSDGNVVQLLKVPLSYAPKQKFLARIQQRPDADTARNIQVVLPRMSFEMVQLDYDPNRKVSPLQQSRSVDSATTATTQYAPTPYNLMMYLYVYARNQDDALQIIEQILPYFNPDYNLTLKAIPELDIKNDLPIILDTIGFEDDYEGDLVTRRSIIWTLSFTMKLNFYGPISKQGIIRRVIANSYNDQELNVQQQKVTVTTNPNTALPKDDFNFVEDFEDF